MESWKLDYFKKEHKDQSINFTTLSKKDCDEVYASFRLAYLQLYSTNSPFFSTKNEVRFMSHRSLLLFTMK